MFLDQVTTKKIKIQCLQDVVNYSEANPYLFDMISEFVKLIKIRLTVPACTARTTERSFSAMRRLTTYLRTFTVDRKLNCLAILHVHSKLTEEYFDKEKTKIINHFIVQNYLRKSTFL